MGHLGREYELLVDTTPCPPEPVGFGPSNLPGEGQWRNPHGESASIQLATRSGILDRILMVLRCCLLPALQVRINGRRKIRSALVHPAVRNGVLLDVWKQDAIHALPLAVLFALHAHSRLGGTTKGREEKSGSEVNTPCLPCGSYPSAPRCSPEAPPTRRGDKAVVSAGEAPEPCCPRTSPCSGCT